GEKALLTLLNHKKVGRIKARIEVTAPPPCIGFLDARFLGPHGINREWHRFSVSSERRAVSSKNCETANCWLFTAYGLEEPVDERRDGVPRIGLRESLSHTGIAARKDFTPLGENAA